MASTSSAVSTTFGTTTDWPNLTHGVILALCNEVGGEPHMFDVVEYLDPHREAQCRDNPNDCRLHYVPMLRQGDCVTIGCNAILHADASLPPISNVDDKTIQIIPRNTFSFPPKTSNCIIQPVAVQSEYMTWHDRRDGRIAQCRTTSSSSICLPFRNAFDCALHPPMPKVLSPSPCVQSEATYYHNFPIGQIKVIQQLMETKTSVCPHPRAGCVVASIHHLGIYVFMIPVENLGVAAASTHDVNWVDSIKVQDVIGVCSMCDAMNELFSSWGRQPDFPKVALPSFNPEAEFTFTNHGRPLANDAQQVLERAPGVPSIMTLKQLFSNSGIS
eukprot:1549590-Amphidinium_carterae.1